MIAIACSTGCPWPIRTAPLTACTAVGELPAIFSAIRRAAAISSLWRWISLTIPSRCASCGGDRVAGHQHLERLPRRQDPGQEDRRASTGREPDHGLGLAEGGVVGGDDEVGALGDLGTAAVGDPVDGGEDRLAQLSQRVEGSIEVLALSQPVLLGHVLALAQVAADREGAVARAGDDGDADRGADRDRLEDLGQARAHLGRDGVVRVRPVQGDERHAPVGPRTRPGPAARAPRDPTAAGRSRAPSSGRCLWGCWPCRPPSIAQVSNSASQRRARRPGAKQYSPPRVTTNGGRAWSRRRIGPLRDRERPGPVVRPDERVLLGRSPDEDAVVQPLGLDELELALRGARRRRRR